VCGCCEEIDLSDDKEEDRENWKEWKMEREDE
jgi:hypothetical protein